MSASTPAERDSSRSAEAIAGTGAEFPFWGLSIGLHALVLGTVLFVAPVREIVLRREKLEGPEVITRGDELQLVIEKIRDRTVERLRARVLLLEAGQDRMARNFATLNRHFQPFVEQQRATAHGRMQAYIDEALTRQERLRVLLEAALSGGDPAEAVAYAQTAMSRTLTAQEEIRRGIRLLELGDELVEEQKAAEEAQYTACQFCRWLEGDLLDIERLQERMPGQDEALAERLAGVPEAQKMLDASKAAVSAAEQKHGDLERHWQEVRKSRERKQEEKEARKAKDAAKREVNTAKRKLTEAERALTRASDDVKRAEADIAKTKQRLAEYREKRQEHLSAARNVQTGACTRQRDVVDTVRSLANEPVNAP